MGAYGLKSAQTIESRVRIRLEARMYVSLICIALPCVSKGLEMDRSSLQTVM
jgi:hypothetical protein